MTNGKKPETPRTDAAALTEWSGEMVMVTVEFAQQLERDLIATQKELANWKEAAKAWGKLAGVAIWNADALKQALALRGEPVAFADRLKAAQAIVESKPTWKRFIDGTPLANDIAVWMAQFAPKNAGTPNTEAAAWVNVVDSTEGPYEFHGMQILPTGKHYLYAAPFPPGKPAAWIEHHKGGDNLNWEPVHHEYAQATPLYAAPISGERAAHDPSIGDKIEAIIKRHEMQVLDEYDANEQYNDLVDAAREVVKALAVSGERVANEKRKGERRIDYGKAGMLNRDCKDRRAYIAPSGERVREALPDIEVAAAWVHAAWMLQKQAQGIYSRKAEDGEELMVDYALLSEKQKNADRVTVTTVYGAIRALPLAAQPEGK